MSAGVKLPFFASPWRSNAKSTMPFHQRSATSKGLLLEDPQGVTNGSTKLWSFAWRI